MKIDTIRLIGLLTILLCFTGGTIAWAAIPKQNIPCSNCHDMGMDKPLLPQYQGPEGCVNCHSSDTSSTTYELDLGGMGGTITVPVVVYTGTSAPTNYLSGGNFWWVADAGGDDDTKGHNVLGIVGQDQNHGEAPGNNYLCANSCHYSLQAQTVIGDLGSGCEGCHLNVTHHADDHPNLEGDLVTNEIKDGDPEGWYRFLSGHMSGDGHGVEGYEDGDWQATSSENDHNEYLGWEGVLGSAGAFYNLGHTMTAFCGGCHGNYHIQQNGGNWTRHASDSRLCPDGLDGCERTGYTTYNPQAPVARPDLTGWTEPSATVDPVTDLVNCLSCHRAHGSPYPKMLRWDMTDTTGKACTTCHTSLIK